MSKNKILSLALGLSMLAVTATPALATEISSTDTSVETAKVARARDNNAIVVNLSDEALNTVASDLGLTVDELKEVLKKSKEKPATKPEKVKSTSDTTSTTSSDKVKKGHKRSKTTDETVTSSSAISVEKKDKKDKTMAKKEGIYFISDEKIATLVEKSGKDTDYVTNLFTTYKVDESQMKMMKPVSRPEKIKETTTEETVN